MKQYSFGSSELGRLKVSQNWGRLLLAVVEAEVGEGAVSATAQFSDGGRSDRCRGRKTECRGMVEGR